ncbi:hypothetical protein FOMG_13191 [Fusarium oxysporum f. sp. melonis 26406]|uniref:Uncharacterized protein n=1 Tax=Fusarium oxysporum f. sp. melonis 26406 TaxID=1089452 RepID=W9ZPZ4_FUSOX|nr:hypothetical protein FOMG_13191 [Fusarium oxysporum f. sp. melonis 26406]
MLLNYLFARASEAAFEGLATQDLNQKDTVKSQAIRFLSYICRCTENCPQYFGLHYDVSTLLQRLEHPRLYPGLDPPSVATRKDFVPMGNYKPYKAEVDLAMESCKAVNDTWNNVRRRDKDRKDVNENSSTTRDSLSSLALGTVKIGDIYKDLSKSSDMVTQRLNEIEELKKQLKIVQITSRKRPRRTESRRSQG